MYNSWRYLKWQFERLGEGYSIRCVKWGLYLTVMGGLRSEVPLAASTFPVSWIVQPDEDHPGSFWCVVPATFYRSLQVLKSNDAGLVGPTLTSSLISQAE